jgi:GNAT superfamily N-acetyltransferase
VTHEHEIRTERQGPYTLRPAQAADLEHLIALLLDLQDHVESSNADLWRMKLDARHNLKGQVIGRLQAVNSCAVVAEHDEDGVVGLIFGRIIVNNRYTPSRAGQIDQAFVRADHRRTGVGSRLVALLCGFFAAEGVEDISLRYVVGNEEAAAFWSAIGFKQRIVTAGVARKDLERELR